MQDNAPVIARLQGVRKRYGNTQALDGLDLQLRAGAVTALLGANGAGKSSTLLSVVGAVRPKAGTVLFDGHDITGLTPDALVMGAVLPEG